MNKKLIIYPDRLDMLGSFMIIIIGVVMVATKKPDILPVFNSKGFIVLGIIIFILKFQISVLQLNKLYVYYFLGIRRKISINQIKHIELYDDSQQYLIITLLNAKTFSDLKYDFNYFRRQIHLNHIIISVPQSKHYELQIFLEKFYPNYSKISKNGKRL